MFATQYTRQLEAKKNYEETGKETLVIKTPVRGNSEKLAQMQLAGVYAEGSRLGYEFEEGDILPEIISTRPKRGADILEVLEFSSKLSAKIQEKVRERIDLDEQRKSEELREKAALDGKKEDPKGTTGV